MHQNEQFAPASVINRDGGIGKNAFGLSTPPRPGPTAIMSRRQSPFVPDSWPDRL